MTSSMKYINLEGLTPLQIIQKYEELLLQRENIIQQLSIQLNDSQQKYIEISETIEILSNKNKELSETKLKCDKTLNQQRTDKDLLFIKLNNLISENDKLTNLISGKKEDIQPTLNINKKQEKNKYKEKETNKKENQIKNNNNMRLELKKQDAKIIQKKIEINKKEDIKKENKKEDNIISTKINDNKKEEIKNEKKEDKKNEKNIETININNEIKEENNKEKKEEKKEEIKNEEKKDDKNEDKKEDKKEDEKNDKDEKDGNKSQSEKKIITINPEEYLAKRKKKKHTGGKKLLSEKISYDPVFK